MTQEEELEQLRALRKQKQAEILGQVTLSPVNKGEKTPGLTPEQKKARIAELEGFNGGEEPMAAKASTPEGPGMMSQIADTAFGLTFPGQLYNQWKQQQTLVKEAQTPGEIPPAVAAVRGGLNTATFGHAPQLAAAVEAPFVDATYPELKAQYEQYYGQSAEQRPAASMLGSELAMQALTRGAGKFVPSASLGSGPAGFFKTSLKTGSDLARGGLLGGMSGVAGTYGVNPSEDLSFAQRLVNAIPSAAFGSVAEALPRAGSLIGREEANREALIRPYEAEVQKRRGSQAAALSKAKTLEKEIPSFIQEKDIEYGRLKETPGYYEQPVNLSPFFKELDKVSGEIKRQSKSGINTQSKEEFLGRVNDIKGKLKEGYGKEGAPKMEDGAYIIGQRGPKQFQSDQIPFSEAHAIQEVINEGFGGDKLMSKLRKPLDQALSGVENDQLSEQFKAAKSAYQKQKQAQRFVSRKGKPEGLPEDRIYKPQLPQSEMPASARSISDLMELIPVVGDKGKKIIESAYMPRLAPTATETMGQRTKPFVSGLGDLLTLILSQGNVSPN